MSKMIYKFSQENRETIEFELEFDDETFDYIPNVVPREMPWAAIDNNRCPNCTLPASCGYCPTAVSILTLPQKIFEYDSFDIVHVEVVTPNRTILVSTTFQRAIASLLGLISATSGCPWTAFFKPSARFHMPFSDEKETMYRTLSMAALEAYVLSQDCEKQPCVPDVIDRVKNVYHNLSIVNSSFAERVRTAFSGDSLVNAIVILDFFAKILPMDIDANVEKLKKIFKR